MPSPDFFGVTDSVRRLTPPAGYEAIHRDGFSWARAGHTYEDTTRIGPEAWNQVIGNFRALLTIDGVVFDDVDPFSPYLLRDTITTFSSLKIAELLPGAVSGVVPEIVADEDFQDAVAAKLPGELDLYTASIVTGLVSGRLEKAENLADVDDVETARGNLGLGTAALAAAADLVSRANHTGRQPAATITELRPTLADIATDAPGASPDYYDTTYYDASQVRGSGARWRKQVGDPDVAIGAVQNASGDWYLIEGAEITPAQLGAKGDGATNDRSIIAAMDGLGRTIRIDRHYLLGAGALTLNSDVLFDGGMLTLTSDLTANGRIINARGGGLPVRGALLRGGRIILDAGPDRTYPTIREALARIPSPVYQDYWIMLQDGHDFTEHVVVPAILAGDFARNFRQRHRIRILAEGYQTVPLPTLPSIYSYIAVGCTAVPHLDYVRVARYSGSDGDMTTDDERACVQFYNCLYGFAKDIDMSEAMAYGVAQAVPFVKGIQSYATPTVRAGRNKFGTAGSGIGYAYSAKGGGGMTVQNGGSDADTGTVAIGYDSSNGKIVVSNMANGVTATELFRAGSPHRDETSEIIDTQTGLRVGGEFKWGRSSFDRHWYLDTGAIPPNFVSAVTGTGAVEFSADKEMRLVGGGSAGTARLTYSRRMVLSDRAWTGGVKVIEAIMAPNAAASGAVFRVIFGTVAGPHFGFKVVNQTLYGVLHNGTSEYTVQLQATMATHTHLSLAWRGIMLPGGGCEFQRARESRTDQTYRIPPGNGPPGNWVSTAAMNTLLTIDLDDGGGASAAYYLYELRARVSGFGQTA